MSCSIPADREENSLLKSPNFVVPSSIVQDPGIKGALFQDDCHQLFVARNAGLCASPSRCTNSAEVFSKGPVDTGFSEHLEDGAGLSLRSQRHRWCDLEDVRAGSSATDGGRGKDVCAGSCDSAGGVGDDVRAGSSAIAGGGGKDVHARFSGFAGRVGADFRAGPSATAGESSGIIGLSDSSVHLSRDSNSLNSSVGVVMSACASAACALPAAVTPRSWSAVARLSDADVAHAHASPMHRARNSGGTGGLLPVQRSTSYCLKNRGRTRVGYRVPRAQGGSKVGFPVRPKICVLSQRWRQG